MNPEMNQDVAAQGAEEQAKQRIAQEEAERTAAAQTAGAENPLAGASEEELDDVLGGLDEKKDAA